MDASKPMLPDMSMEEENERLKKLWTECEIFLLAFKAYIYTTEDRPIDAFIAISELQRDIVTRRAYILGALQQRELPF